MKILEYFSKLKFPFSAFALCSADVWSSFYLATLLNLHARAFHRAWICDSQRQLQFAAAQVRVTHASRTKTISYTTEVQLLGWTHSLLFYFFKHSWLSTLFLKKLIWKTYFYSSNINILYSPFCCKDTRLIYMLKRGGGGKEGLNPSHYVIQNTTFVSKGTSHFNPKLQK